jgi:ATP-dependent Zn protease
LVRHKDKLVTVSEKLMSLETIEGMAFDEIMGLAQAASTYSS